MKVSENFFLFKYHYTFYIIIIILLYLMLNFSNEYNIMEVHENYPKFRKLPSGEYFVILSGGIYIYNNNFSNYNQIFKFVSPYTINNDNENNKTVLVEIKNNTNLYILCLIKSTFYLFDYKQKNIAFYYYFDSIPNDAFYNLIPYKIIDTFIYFIIIYSKKESKRCGTSYNYFYSLNFFEYKIDVKNNKIYYNEKKNNFEIENGSCSSFITDYNFNCQLVSQKYLICLYLIENNKKISITKFDIENNFEYKNIYEMIYKNNYINKIIQIKTSISSQTNNLLICIYWNYYDYDYYYDYYYYYTNCFIYNINGNKFEYILSNKKDKQNLAIYYFNETSSFILIFNDNNQNLFLYTINNLSKDPILYDYQSNYECDKISSFDVNYNNENKEYDLISDCYIPKNENKWNVIIYNNYMLDSNYSTPSNLEEEGEDDESFLYEDEEGEEMNNYLIKDLNEVEEEYDKEENQEIVKTELTITKEELLKNLTILINNIEIRKNYEFIGEDYNVVIKPINSSYLESSTHINFTQCENTLRNILNISSSRILTFLQMEINNKNDKSITNNVGYQVYDDNKNLLDLSLCNDSNIQVFHSIKNSSLINLNSIFSFKNLGIDILNINDSFFNDICHPYSDSENDLVLQDRIKYIYQNYSLCDEGCSYNEINIENMTISCNCKIKTNLSTNETSLNIENLEDIKTESNFGLIKCYKLVFSFEGKLKNIGFWIFLILIIAHFPLLIIYFKKGIKPILDYLINEMQKHGYMNENNSIINKKRKKKIRTFNNIRMEKYNKNNGNRKSNPPPKCGKIFNNNNIINTTKKGLKKSKVIGSPQHNNIIQININDNKKKRKSLTFFRKKLKSKTKVLDNNDSKLMDNSKNIIRNVDNIPTQGIKTKENLNEEKNNNFNINLININLNNIQKYDQKILYIY